MDPPALNSDDDESSGVSDEDVVPSRPIISDGDDEISITNNAKVQPEEGQLQHDESAQSINTATQSQELKDENEESRAGQKRSDDVAKYDQASYVDNEGENLHPMSSQPPMLQPHGPFIYPHIPQHHFNPYDHQLPYGSLYAPVHQFPPLSPPPPMQHLLHSFVDAPYPNHSYTATNQSSLNNAAAMAHAYHEQAARMRDHAAAYANAAAGAAWAAAQIASAAAEFATSAGGSSYYSNAGNELTAPPESQDVNNLPQTGHSNHSEFVQSASIFPSVPIQQTATPYLTIPGRDPWLVNFHCYENSGIAGQPNSCTAQSDSHGNLPNEATSRNIRKNKNCIKKHANNGNLHDQQSESFHRSRRKRHQRLLPEGPSVPPEILQLGMHQNRGKIRRRLRSDGDSSTTSSGSSFMPHSANGINSSRTRTSYHHNKKKARSDESLLGKTAVAALFEWCGKRQITPNFVLEQPSQDDFDFVVYLDEIERCEISREDDDDENADEKKPKALVFTEGRKEWGRGRGRNKVAAKQEAARKALQALIPGVIFDDDTGMVIELPRISSSLNTPQRNDCLDDLAPNLAKQLAIGRDNSTDTTPKHHQQPKRTLDIYPGTSTTSEEEDENTYYTSRGASVCSVLLHAMIQIDSARIPEAPIFTYQVAPSPLLTSQQNAQLRRKVSSGKPLPAVRAMRGSFTCTARLKIREVSTDNTDENSSVGISKVENESSLSHEDSLPSASVTNTNEATKSLDVSLCQPTTVPEMTFEAIGTGSTKRESRHIASAKLLALLFPDCKDMIEVKAAAEAMREKYVASKILKQTVSQSTARRQDQEGSFEDSFQDHRRPNVAEEAPMFAFVESLDPPLPSQIENRFRFLLNNGIASEQATNLKETLMTNSNIPCIESNDQFDGNITACAAFRHLSRQKQIDMRVESALQKLNDRDEEGRTLPEELTADDVGRLVLRRAEPEDIPRIKKFNFVSKVNRQDGIVKFDSLTIGNSLSGDQNKVASRFLCRKPSTGSDESINDNPDLVSQLWAPSSIVLLLCRAIAAFEDPPLGCAVLTLGFSLEHGSIIRLSQIASERHLPIERFLESLQNFSNCMKCHFEIQNIVPNKNTFSISYDEMSAIVESHVNNDNYSNNKKKSDEVNCINTINERGGFSGSTSKLQSVQEESEISDSSSNEKRPGKRASKPSKRSRFA